jgi:coenzyme F420-dependent glucose-6-phosphate dehydrogenase
MVHLGYMLSSEEHSAQDLVALAARAEQAGFEYAMISDHYHPWIDEQGQSPFVWSVLGGIARETGTLRVGTAVTCPIIRYHPAIIAQAAATVAQLMPGRFMLGVGTGEAINEHITGERFPALEMRMAMLEEAIGIIRSLWSGRMIRHYGKHFTVENARVYSRPQQPPPVIVAASGKHAAELAGRIGDGLINFEPSPEIMRTFAAAGGEGKPRYVQYKVCWAADEAQARRTARAIFPTAALRGEVTTLLPNPAHMEQATAMITEEQVAQAIVCGPDPQRHVQGIRACEEAGFDHVHVHQVGPDQEGFFRFYEEEILPQFRSAGAMTTAAGG